MKLDAWFRPVSARPLAGLRIGLPLLLFAHFVWVSSDLLSLHGSRGIIPWELTNVLRDPWVPGLPTLATSLVPLGIAEPTAIALLLAGYGGSLLWLASGFHPRLAAFVAWGLHLSVVTSGSASFYGVDQLANTFLFYLVLFPSGRAWTFASHSELPGQETGQETSIPVGSLRVMQLHLCVIYLAAGLEKAMGSQWWNGEAIWQTVSQPVFSTFDLSWLASYPSIPMAAGWGTLVVEIGYSFLVWPRWTRKAWCSATIAFHLGTALFMGLVFFSALMILLTGCLFLIPEDETAEQRSVGAQRKPVPSAILLIVGMIALGGGEARAETRVREAVLPPDFAPLVKRLMARDRIPGVAVGVIERGRLVYARGFGHRDVETNRPVTPDTLFGIGSCSKAFTATALALLADEGRIALDQPVRTYLPDFALQDPVASAMVTTRDLLTHRSGLPRHDFFWYQAPFSREELYRRVRFLEPAGPPHAQWHYSSLNFVVAGRIVEKISGMSWERFVRTRILAPLHMMRTVLSAEAMEGDSNHAAPYVLRDGRLEKMPMLKPLSAIAAAGAVQTSVRDLARWLAFHATRSPRLLRERTWRELHRSQAEMPPSEMSEVQNPGYALGWIHETYRGHPLVLHNGAIDGYTVQLGFLPETGQGLILLMNRDLATDALRALAYSAYDRLLHLEPIDWEARFREAPDPMQPVPTIALDLPIEALSGRYEHPAYGPLTVRAQGSKLIMEFRSLRFTLAYQGNRRFLSEGPIADGAPQIAVRFSEQQRGEPLKLFVPLNLEDGDPVEVFTRVR